jgi:hypothetical protein
MNESGKWFAEMRRLKATEGAGYSLLDAAQLIKHALGLARGRNNTIVNLVYVYWEPIDASLSPLFTQHRTEIVEFTERVTGDNPTFESMSYSELWRTWTASGDDSLLAHVQNLRTRYELPAWVSDGHRPDR